jgi:uncharacterized protein YceK
MFPTMRITLLLTAVVLGSMLLGCGSVNNHQASQPKSINRSDPLMNTHYLNSRIQR